MTSCASWSTAIALAGCSAPLGASRSCRRACVAASCSRSTGRPGLSSPRSRAPKIERQPSPPLGDPEPRVHAPRRRRGRRQDRPRDQFVHRCLDRTTPGVRDRRSRYAPGSLGVDGPRERGQARAGPPHGSRITPSPTSSAAVRQRRVDPYFAELAELVTAGIEAAGIPRCTGDAMAVTPGLRRSVEGWGTAFRRWMTDLGREGSIFSSITFDHRRVSGPLDIEPTLHAVIAEAPDRYPDFLRHLARRALDEKPPTGFKRNLVVESKGSTRGASTSSTEASRSSRTSRGSTRSERAARR